MECVSAINTVSIRNLLTLGNVSKSISSANNFYLCSICGFVSEHQRAVKSHVWKHIGQKDVEYPTFDEGNHIESVVLPLNIKSHLSTKPRRNSQSPLTIMFQNASLPKVQSTAEVRHAETDSFDVMVDYKHSDSNVIVVRDEANNDGCQFSDGISQNAVFNVPGIASELEIVTQCQGEKCLQGEDDHAGYALCSDEKTCNKKLSSSQIGSSEPKREVVDPNGKKVWQSLLTVIEQLRKRTGSEGEMTVIDETGCASDKTLAMEEEQSSVDQDTDAFEDMRNNIEKFNGGYRCIICYYSNNSLQHMKAHMKMHRKCGVYQCCLCMFRAANKKNLQQHMLMHCRRRRFICSVCKEMFFYRSQLRIHMRMHNEYSSVGKVECNVHTPDKPDVNMVEVADEVVVVSTSTNHKDEQQMADVEDNFAVDGEDPVLLKNTAKTWTCEVCAHTFLSMRALKAHQQSHDSVRYVCGACNYKSSSIRSLKSHMKCHYNDRRFVEQPLEQYKCNLCGYLCHYLPSLKGHMWKHATHADFDYRLLEENALSVAVPAGAAQVTASASKDVADALPLIVYRCCNCGFESTSRTALDEHMATHKDIIQKLLVMNTVPVTEG